MQAKPRDARIDVEDEDHVVSNIGFFRRPCSATKEHTPDGRLRAYPLVIQQGLRSSVKAGDLPVVGQISSQGAYSCFGHIRLARIATLLGSRGK